MNSVRIQNKKGEPLRDDPGCKPKDMNGTRITRCKDCPNVEYKAYEKPGTDGKVGQHPYCSIAGAHGRYIIKHYWEHDRIASYCKLEDYKDLPKKSDRFKNLIFEENDNASNKE